MFNDTQEKENPKEIPPPLFAKANQSELKKNMAFQSLIQGKEPSTSGVFNLLYHATPLTDFGMLATPHNDNVKM